MYRSNFRLMGGYLTEDGEVQMLLLPYLICRLIILFHNYNNQIYICRAPQKLLLGFRVDALLCHFFWFLLLFWMHCWKHLFMSWVHLSLFDWNMPLRPFARSTWRGWSSSSKPLVIRKRSSFKSEHIFFRYWRILFFFPSFWDVFECPINRRFYIFNHCKYGASLFNNWWIGKC